MRRCLAFLIVAALLAGCGADDEPPAARAAPATATATATTTAAATTRTPAKATRIPSADDIAAAKAICAEPFYAQAFDSPSECEAEMSDPKAVAELRESVENFGKPTP